MTLSTGFRAAAKKRRDAARRPNGGAQSDAFGTQGDVWDTQEDMATALVGAIVGQLVLRRWHGRQIQRVTSS